jgi:hypothetical protein
MRPDTDADAASSRSLVGARESWIARWDQRLSTARLTPRRGVLVATLIYAAYSVFLTWPLASTPGGLLSGVGVSGDLGGSVSQVGYVVQHHVFPFLPATFHGLNAPEGLQQPWVENLSGLPSNALLFGLGYIFGAVAGSNVFLWLSYVMSGLSIFLLTRRLFGSFGAALLAGFAFAFFPWAVDKLNGHYQYMDGWVLVLGVWRMLELADRPTVRNALIAGSAVAFGMWWTPYFILIGGVGFVVMEIVVLGAGILRRGFWPAFRGAALAGVPIVVVFGGLGVLAVVAGGSETGALRAQSIQDLYAYSARWAEWFLPDRNNLIFGGATSPYLVSHLHGSNFSESSLYLGISVVALSAAGAWLAARGIWMRRRQAAADMRVVAVVSGVLLALVAAWFSSPPKIHFLGIWVPTPSDVVFQFTSTWRVYTRFVELIELGLCIPMAFAIAKLLAHRSRPVALALFGTLAVVLILDLWARPPIRTVSTKAPPAYVWLRDHPGGIVADYPINPAVYPDYADLFWQSYDGHPLLQGYAANSETESMKLDLANLAEPSTAGYLADLGVKYVVVHPGDPGADLQTVRRDHYIIRFASPSGSVWQVGASPAPTRVDALDGFSVVEGAAGAQYRWIAASPGVLGVYARNCSTCTGTVRFEAGSNAQPRIMTVREQATGKVLLRVTVPPGRFVGYRILGVTLHNGRARLLITTNIPPVVPPGGGDLRTLSIAVREPHLRLSG